MRSEAEMNELAFDHPLFPIMLDAIKQAMFGRKWQFEDKQHIELIPFLQQPWVHYAKIHGRGFLTGQAAKKLDKAAAMYEGEDFEQELLDVIVYCGMAILAERRQNEDKG